ncbi:MAG: DUF2726 domain-containing protein [Burkholderiales bacterium]|nr:DUF2726 domain-containing protein [Burkholderiales bacterium]
MEFLPPIDTLAVPAGLALVLTWFVVRLRQRGVRSEEREALDTVAGWPPESARVLTIDERQAYELLHRSLPGLLVLAQVPLSRFLRVPMRHSYAEWLQRVGSLSADLVVCDGGSRVLAVVDIRAVEESSRSRRRHERMARVLQAAGVQVFTWREGDLPSAQNVRNALAPLIAPPKAALKPKSSSPMPLIPVPEMEEILAEGDRLAAEGEALEPMPSGFFDQLEPVAAGTR